MQYNQSMINLVYAIRGCLSESEKTAIKTTNPELLEDLAEIYRHKTDDQLRGHIEALLTLAGKTWFDLLHKDTRVASQKSQVLAYCSSELTQETRMGSDHLISNDAKIISLAPTKTPEVQVAFG